MSEEMAVVAAFFPRMIVHSAMLFLGERMEVTPAKRNSEGIALAVCTSFAKDGRWSVAEQTFGIL